MKIIGNTVKTPINPLKLSEHISEEITSYIDNSLSETNKLIGDIDTALDELHNYAEYLVEWGGTP